MYKLHNYISVGYFVLSSLILSLAFNWPQKLGFLSFIFLVPILFYLLPNRNKKSLEIVVRRRTDFFNMFIFGLLVAFLSTYWFAFIYPLTWIGIDSKLLGIPIVFGLWSSLAVFMALPMAFWVILMRKFLRQNILIISMSGASLWVIGEYIRSFLIIIGLYSDQVLFGPHHTYYSLSYLIPNIPIVKNLIPIGGIYLGSFFVILVNFLIYFLVEKYLNKEVYFASGVKYLAIYIVILLLISNLLITNIRSKDLGVEKDFYLGNSYFPSSKVKSDQITKRSSSLQFVNNYLESKYGIQVETYILPENIDLTKSFKENRKVFVKDLFLISSRTESTEKMYYIDTKNANTRDFYQKKLLMPIGEYNVSYVSFLLHMFGFDNLEFPEVNKGEKEFLVEVDDAVFGSSICSENISPYLYQGAVKSGANVLVNIASHGPFRKSELLGRQTQAINSIRALETGRYFITATNYGKSFVVSDEGDLVFISNNPDIDGSIYFDKTSFKTKKYTTPYTAYGDFIVYFSLMFILIGFSRFLLMRKKHEY